MQTYVEVIKTAFAIFPLIAFLISLPFIIWQYHKHGSISFWQALIIYSFVFYLTCAFFLVILPLPEIDEVAAMTSPRTQLIPFKFVMDFVQHTSLKIMDIRTYWSALTESYFFVPIYNILLTLPFGIYLRYFCKCKLSQVAIGTLLLSLFFELTQLTGLYFIYPRGYRLFDVDDLILNTLGGMLGYVIARPITQILPDPDQIEAKAREKGVSVSGPRRSLAFILDLVTVIILSALIQFALPGDLRGFWAIMIGVVGYYFLLPACLNGSTPMEKFLNLRVIDETGEMNILRIWLRRGIFLMMYVGLPELIFWLWRELPLTGAGEVIVVVIYTMGFLLYFGVTGLRFLCTSEPMLYEKLSKTRLISTIMV